MTQAPRVVARPAFQGSRIAGLREADLYFVRLCSREAIGRTASHGSIALVYFGKARAANTGRIWGQAGARVRLTNSARFRPCSHSMRCNTSV
jgi:hypothetical protein